MDKVIAGLGTYELDTHTDSWGGVRLTASNGNMRVGIHHSVTGEYRVVCRVSYGEFGTSWCESANYKTPGGAVRKASAFLGAVKAA